MLAGLSTRAHGCEMYGMNTHSYPSPPFLRMELAFELVSFHGDLKRIGVFRVIIFDVVPSSTFHAFFGPQTN